MPIVHQFLKLLWQMLKCVMWGGVDGLPAAPGSYWACSGLRVLALAVPSAWNALCMMGFLTSHRSQIKCHLLNDSMRVPSSPHLKLPTTPLLQHSHSCLLSCPPLRLSPSGELCFPYYIYCLPPPSGLSTPWGQEPGFVLFTAVSPICGTVLVGIRRALSIC